MINILNREKEANIQMNSLQTFEFAFNLHLIKSVLEISYKLSQELH
jgi:hypothetical protein